MESLSHLVFFLILHATFKKDGRENLIEIHRNSGEKLIWLKWLNSSVTPEIFPIEISIHSNRLSIQIYRQKTDLKVLNIFSIKTYQIFPAGSERLKRNTGMRTCPTITIRVPRTLLYFSVRAVYLIGTALSTVVSRFWFDSRGRSQRAWSGISIGRTSHGRSSHVLYLELRHRPALPMRLRVPGIEPETCSRSFGHHIKALALSFWTYTVLGEFWTTKSRKNTLKNIHWCWPGFEIGPPD